MTVTSIADCLTMDDGAPVMAVAGIIDAIFDQNSGENFTGPWRLQNLTLRDPADKAVKIAVKFKKEEALPLSSKGKKVYFEMTKGAKGFNGIKIGTDTYNNKSKTVLIITPTCQVSFPDEVKPSGGKSASVHGDDHPPGLEPKPTASQRQPDPNEGEPDRPTPSRTETANNRFAQRNQGQTVAAKERESIKPPSAPVYGGTVGMAINNAVKLAQDAGLIPGTVAFNKFIYEISSDLIRISLALESGRLAAVAKDRETTAGQ